ncbi:MAG: GNAT family N-acetyltransferase, partial [Acidimicrobiia bacterium]
GPTITKWGRTNFWFNRSRFLARHPRGEDNTIGCTADLLDRFHGSVVPARFWNETSDFLDTKTGHIAVDRDSGAAAALAFAAYLDDTFLEIGVETLPRFQGRGYARSACARLIHDCLDRGLTPVWSCRTENKGSFRLAESLGFVPVLQLPYYELPWSESVG